MNRNKMLLVAGTVLFFLLLGSFAASSAISSSFQTPDNTRSTTGLEQQGAVTTEIINGTINGTNITYEYGNRTFTDSGNFTVEEQGFINETVVEERIVETQMELIDPTSFELTNIIWEVELFIQMQNGNRSGTLYFENATFFEWLDNLTANNWVAGTIENYDIVEAYAITNTTQDYLGRFSVNQSFANFTRPLLKWNLTMLFAPKVFLVYVQTIPYNVVMYNTVTTAFLAAYYMRYSFKYNIEASEWYVEIKDGDNLFFHLSAPRSLTLNYTEIQFMQLWYYFVVFNNVTLTFANGTKVPFEMYPFSISPYFIRVNGTIQEFNINFANLTAISTATTVLQAFKARYSETVNNTDINATALVAWAVQSAPRLAAYADGNLDGQLNLQFSPDEGLDVTDGDSVPFIGLTEAYKGTAISVHHVNQTQDSQIIARIGLYDILNETEKGKQRVRTDIRYQEFNVGGDFTDAQMVTHFNDPVVDGDLVIFDFGVEYQDFPVTWVSTRDGSQTVVPMTIAYDYEYTINTTAGEANLSPIITYGSLDADPTFKARVQGLGLATIYYSDLLTAFAFHAKRVEEAPENVTSSRAALFKVVRFSGPVSDFSTINATGDKATYTINNQTYGANISVLNLVKVSASVVAANVTVFESETGDALSSSYLQQTEVFGIHVGYRKDLILVSYPVWDGEEIVHDPTFSAVYVPGETQQQPPTPTETTGPISGTETGGEETTATTLTTSPPEESKEAPTPTQPVPGFTALSFVMLTVTLSVVLVINRRKKQ